MTDRDEAIRRGRKAMQWLEALEPLRVRRQAEMLEEWLKEEDASKREGLWHRARGIDDLLRSLRVDVEAMKHAQAAIERETKRRQGKTSAAP